jgi:tetratricopeptide (TPR) repeat protein
VDVEARLPDEDLDRMLAALGDGSPEGRRSAASVLCALGPEAVEPVGRRLASLRRDNDEGAASLLHALRERSPKDGGPDLLEWLLSQQPSGAVTRALEMDAMLRALAHAATVPAVRLLVGAASDLAGAFRPEIARLVRGLGEQAIPALVESRRDPAPEVRSWGAALLGAIVKHPSEALRIKDDRLLADVLRAYGKVSDMEALQEILPLANSDRVQVRAAAREAVLAYGQDGVWRLREAYAVLLGEQAPDGVTAADLAKKLFEAYDRYRLRDVYALIDRGVALERAGKAAEAVAVFDEALAREPLVERRAEMVPAYVDLATSREASDPAAAGAGLRTALRLDENGPGSAHLRSELHRLEGEALVARGVDDATPFEQALAIDPGNRAARDDLLRLRPPAESSHGRDWRLVAAAGVLALAIAGVLTLGGRKRRTV